MQSAVLADPTRALQETNRGSGPAMEESENDVGSPEQLLRYADEHYLAVTLPLGDHLGKVLHGVEEYHQRKVGPLRRSCRCSSVKGSARKGRLHLRVASARCLEIVCGTIATPTSARVVERITVWSTSAFRTIVQSSLLVVFLVAPDSVFCAWVPSRVHCSQQFLMAHFERSTWPATRCIDQPAFFIPMIRPLSNSLNWKLVHQGEKQSSLGTASNAGTRMEGASAKEKRCVHAALKKAAANWHAQGNLNKNHDCRQTCEDNAVGNDSAFCQSPPIEEVPSVIIADTFCKDINPLSGYRPPEKLFRKRFTLILLLP
ncbi:uncharacterized protein TNCV_395721 [Trichonephila clavipes]|nr:uncharacterized protein TNCV_395721 [Trichonephila clavipes]